MIDRKGISVELGLPSYADDYHIIFIIKKNNQEVNYKRQ